MEGKDSVARVACTPVTSRGQKAQLRQAQAPHRSQPRHRRQDVNGRGVLGVAAAAPNDIPSPN